MPDHRVMEMNTKSQSLMSLRDAARRLGVGYPRACELAREGILPVVRLGRTIRVDPAALDEFIRSGGKPLPGGWRREAA